MSLIEVKDLYFSYNDSDKAIDGITFNIEKGTYTTIIGHNGSGKPTLAKLIAGLLPIKKGEIIIDGKNGVIIPPRDEEALYQAMKRFVTHPDEVASMAANARPLIASRYEQGYVRQCLYDFYKEILED